MQTHPLFFSPKRGVPGSALQSSHQPIQAHQRATFFIDFDTVSHIVGWQLYQNSAVPRTGGTVFHEVGKMLRPSLHACK